MTYMSGTEHKRLRRLRRQAFNLQNGLCFWCGEPMALGVPQSDPLCCTADHHPIPRHQGGRTRPGNIVAAHGLCNETRHPELNTPPGSGKGGVVFSAGESSSRSPFEILRQTTGERA